MPSLGLDENTGTSSHGDRASFAAAGCAGAPGDGCCAYADADIATAITSADSRVTRCLIIAGAVRSLGGITPFLHDSRFRFDVIASSGSYVFSTSGSV